MCHRTNIAWSATNSNTRARAPRARSNMSWGLLAANRIGQSSCIFNDSVDEDFDGPCYDFRFRRIFDRNPTEQTVLFQMVQKSTKKNLMILYFGW